jgi:hypothetical protein
MTPTNPSNNPPLSERSPLGEPAGSPRGDPMVSPMVSPILSTPLSSPLPLGSSGSYEALSYELSGGRLDLRVDRADLPFEDLCALGSRHNIKRSFIFISKVLGKHWPVKPGVMATTHRALARKLYSATEGEKGPMVFIGMAETAIGLGRGVFEEFAELAGADRPLLFTQTTRYNLRGTIAIRMDEPHSHARSHIVYYPIDSEKRRLFSGAETLVLIDDEISTGRTLKNLAGEFVKFAPRLKRLILTSIVNWLPGKDPESLKREFPLKVTLINLLEGSFEFFPKEKVPDPPLFRSEGDFSPKDHILTENYGRFGLSPEDLPAISQKIRGIVSSLSPDISRERALRVIGTGEFLHEPFLLSRYLEDKGLSVTFQSTTRTPMALGGGVKDILSFPDNYHENLHNFLYNLSEDFTGETIIVYETKSLPEDHDLPERLKAKTEFF